MKKLGTILEDEVLMKSKDQMIQLVFLDYQP